MKIFNGIERLVKRGDFEGAAGVLLNGLAVSINGSAYRMVEIELYLHAPGHEDKKTLKRAKGSGELFFHMYGVDVSLKSRENIYGGFLIRSVRNIKTGKYINGPRNVAIELTNNIKNGDNRVAYQELPSWEKKEKMERLKRITGAKTNKEYLDKEYRFVIEFDNTTNKYKR